MDREQTASEKYSDRLEELGTRLNLKVVIFLKEAPKILISTPISVQNKPVYVRYLASELKITFKGINK